MALEAAPRTMLVCLVLGVRTLAHQGCDASGACSAIMLVQVDAIPHNTKSPVKSSLEFAKVSSTRANVTAGLKRVGARPQARDSPRIKTGTRTGSAHEPLYGRVQWPASRAVAERAAKKDLKTRPGAANISAAASKQRVGAATIKVPAGSVPAHETFESVDLSIINSTLDMMEHFVVSINSSAIDMLSHAAIYLADFSHVLSDVQNTIDDARRQLEKEEASENSDAKDEQTLKSFISWASGIVSSVNNEVPSLTEHLQKVQAETVSTLSKVMPQLRCAADKIYSVLAGLTEQLGLIESPPGVSLSRSRDTVSLLEARRAAGGWALASRGNLELSVARKFGGGGKFGGFGGGGSECDQLFSMIRAANGTVNKFSNMLSDANVTLGDVLSNVVDVAEGELQAMTDTCLKKADELKISEDKYTTKAMGQISTALQKLSSLDDFPDSRDAALAGVETAIVQAQASCRSLCDAAKTAADLYCKIVDVA